MGDVACGPATAAALPPGPRKKNGAVHKTKQLGSSSVSTADMAAGMGTAGAASCSEGGEEAVVAQMPPTKVLLKVNVAYIYISESFGVSTSCCFHLSYACAQESTIADNIVILSAGESWPHHDP